MDLSQYQDKIVRVVDQGGRSFTGIASAYPAEYGLHEFDREEESVKLNDYQLFESDMATIEELPGFSILRATETWQQAGTDNDFPIATARMYPLDAHSMMIGRVVVLPEYRRLGIGTMVVNECETWAEELGFSKTVVESRDNKIAFYEQMLYEVCGEAVDGETFRCVRMEKQL